MRGSNLRLAACKATTLPTELTDQNRIDFCLRVLTITPIPQDELALERDQGFEPRLRSPNDNDLMFAATILCAEEWNRTIVVYHITVVCPATGLLLHCPGSLVTRDFHNQLRRRT